MTPLADYLRGAAPRANPPPMPPGLDPAVEAAVRAYEQAVRAFVKATGDVKWSRPDGSMTWLTWPQQLRTMWLPWFLKRSEGEAPSEVARGLVEYASEILAGIPVAAERAARLRREREEEEAWEGQAFVGDADARAALSGKLVWFYHGTSDALLEQFLKHGLRHDPPRRAWDDATRGYVYLSLNPSWVDIYEKRAVAKHGGDPITLRLIVPWDWTSSDDDDADLQHGRWQRRVPFTLDPAHLFEVIRGSNTERMRGLLDPSSSRDAWAAGFRSPASEAAKPRPVRPSASRARKK